jgi:hypothetical protein
MIIVRIEKATGQLLSLKLALEKVPGADMTKEDEDQENFWFNITADDENLLEKAVDFVTSAWTRY